MEVVFLGTSCMVPTKERNQAGTFLTYKGIGILLDCGENIQRQMKLAGIPLSKINKILITHWHGDHVLGLMGIIQSLGALEEERVLEIYAPKGTKKYFKSMCESIAFDFRVKVNFNEVGDGVIYENADYILSSAKMKHRLDCVGYSFKEKDYNKVLMNKLLNLGVKEGPHIGLLQTGKDITWEGKKIKSKDYTKKIIGRKITYITDTLLVNNCYKLAEDSDLLICESPYTSELQEKADEYTHMTSKDAGLLASKSNCKQLILTHISARYKTSEELEEEAKTYFDNAKVGYDFMKIKL